MHLLIISALASVTTTSDNQPSERQTGAVQTSLIQAANISQSGQTTAALAQTLLASTLIKTSSRPVVDTTAGSDVTAQQVPVTSQKPALKIMNVTPQTVLNASGQTLLKAGTQTLLLGNTTKPVTLQSNASNAIQILTKPTAAIKQTIPTSIAHSTQSLEISGASPAVNSVQLSLHHPTVLNAVTPAQPKASDVITLPAQASTQGENNFY